MIKLYFKVFSMVIFLGFNAYAKQELGERIQINIGSKYQIKSQYLNETRELLIHLPKDYYSKDKSYPVIYLLDGNNHFKHSVSGLKVLTRYERAPDSIIVAIPNNTRMRNRDLGEGREGFIQFIEHEVLPFVAKNYRTSDVSTLFGHSSMGALTMEIFATKMALFDHYIAASPAIGVKTALLEKFKTAFNNKQISNTSLFFTVTDKENEVVGFTEGNINFDKFLTEQAPENFNWHYEFIPEQTHMSTPYLTFYAGLSKAFNVSLK